MLILFALVSLIFSVVLVVTAVYEKIPSWAIIGLLGNMSHSINFLFRVMS